MIKCLALLGMILGLVGCQSTNSVVPLPPPSYSRQTVTVPQPVTPRPPVVAGRPGVPTPPPRNVTVADNPPAGWVPTVPARQWKWIVIHHSSTAAGGAKAFDQGHRDKGWDELGYDFVIGNGSYTGDGQVEVGPRWIKQKTGAHASTPDHKYNEYGIGICLVGDFEITRPSARQMESLAKLVAFLQKRYNIPADRVIGHRDTKSTDCPGRNMNLQVVRRMAAQQMADENAKAAKPIQ